MRARRATGIAGGGSLLGPLGQGPSIAGVPPTAGFLLVTLGQGPLIAGVSPRSPWAGSPYAGGPS